MMTLGKKIQELHWRKPIIDWLEISLLLIAGSAKIRNGEVQCVLVLKFFSVATVLSDKAMDFH